MGSFLSYLMEKGVAEVVESGKVRDKSKISFFKNYGKFVRDTRVCRTTRTAPLQGVPLQGPASALGF